MSSQPIANNVPAPHAASHVMILPAIGAPSEADEPEPAVQFVFHEVDEGPGGPVIRIAYRPVVLPFAGRLEEWVDDLRRAYESAVELLRVERAGGRAAVANWAIEQGGAVLDFKGKGEHPEFVAGADEAAYHLGALRREGLCPGCGLRIYNEVAERGGCLSCYPELPADEAATLEP